MKKLLLFASAVAVLFSSCSTDNTADVIGGEVKGAISATAAYQQEDTRTYLNETGKVFWSKGDALGVFGKAGVQTQFGLVSGEDTASGKFAGNTNFLKVGEPIFAYYPFNKNADLKDNKSIELEILAQQTYFKPGTFDAAQAPAYAYVKELESKDDIDLTFKGAAAYLAFPIKGFGTLESLTLSIDNQVLNGAAYVDITKEDDPETENVDESPALTFEGVTATAENTVNTLVCGGIELNPFEPVTVMFVVPVGVDVKKEISLTAKIDGKTINHKRPAATTGTPYSTIANEKATIVYNTAATTLAEAAWSFGLEKTYVIAGDNDQAALDFLAYAYVAQADNYLRPEAGYEWGENGSTAEDWVALTEYFGENPYNYTAVAFVEKIDLAAFDADAKFAQLGTISKPTSKDLFYRNVLAWYINNGYAIESLHSYYRAAGDPIGVVGAFEEPTEISDLTVIGNGITTGAKLVNLKFSNSTVFATRKNKNIGFIAPKFDDATIKDVTIGEGNVLNTTVGTTQYIGGIFGYAYANNLPAVTVEALPAFMSTYKTAAPQQLGQLYGFLYMDKNLAIDLTANKVADFDAPVVYETYAKGVLDFTNAPVAATYANVITKNVSSVVINNTSYWNGAAATEVNNDTYFTAEELAYVLANNKVNTQYTLTDNIDMQCFVETDEDGDVVDSQILAHSVHSTNCGIWLDGTADQFEIKNIIANAVTNAQGLFGYNAKITNLKISNVTLEVDNATPAYIAGLAQTGTAKNVVVDGLAINIAKNVATPTVNSIGGIFSVVDDYNSVDNVEVKALAINYAGEKSLKAATGVIAGTMNIEPNTTIDLKVTKLTGRTTAYVFTNVSADKQPATNNAKTALKWYKAANYGQNTVPYGVINVTNAAFGIGNTHVYLNDNVASKNFGRLAGGIVFDAALINAAKAFGKDSSVEYKYNFHSNTKINNDADANGNFVWGFNNVAAE